MAQFIVESYLSHVYATDPDSAAVEAIRKASAEPMMIQFEVCTGILGHYLEQTVLKVQLSSLVYCNRTQLSAAINNYYG